MDNDGKTQNQTLRRQLGVSWHEAGLESPNSDFFSAYCFSLDSTSYHLQKWKISKFSGVMPTCFVWQRSDYGQTVLPSNRESHSLKSLRACPQASIFCTPIMLFHSTICLSPSYVWRAVHRQNFWPPIFIVPSASGPLLLRDFWIQWEWIWIWWEWIWEWKRKKYLLTMTTILK